MTDGLFESISQKRKTRREKEPDAAEESASDIADNHIR